MIINGPQWQEVELEFVGPKTGAAYTEVKASVDFQRDDHRLAPEWGELMVSGAGSLWQWRISPDEPGRHHFFLDAGSGWREVLTSKVTAMSAWSAGSSMACRSPTRCRAGTCSSEHED